MKEHLPRVYWRDVPPEDTRLLAPGGTRPTGQGWTEFRGLSGAFFRDLDFQADSRADGPLTGSLVAPATPVLRELEPPRGLSVKELDEPAVARLAAINPYSERSVLVPEGTLFLGGAQNRMIRKPTLVPPGLHELPVFCVEMGRWDLGARDFGGLTRLPGLLSHKIGGIDTEDLQDRQAQVWELIYESLTMLGQLNPTLNVNGWRASGERTNADRSSAGPDEQEAVFAQPENWRGYFAIDPPTGLASLHLAPHEAFGGLSVKAARRDLDWRASLRGNAQGAREFFRIFDESKGLAIRCLPDGRALRDIRKRPILFGYKPEDLAHSFRPPIEKPPGPPPLSFAGENHFADLPQFLERIGESRARLTRLGSESFELELAHPELALRGSGLVYKNELASLDVAAFRPFAEARN